LKPAQANSSRDPTSKKKFFLKRRTGGVAQGVGPEFNSQYCKKKKKSFPMSILTLFKIAKK
jgi:hypothetical protein